MRKGLLNPGLRFMFYISVIARGRYIESPGILRLIAEAEIGTMLIMVYPAMMAVTFLLQIPLKINLVRPIGRV
jgi:hypothetical protein